MIIIFYDNCASFNKSKLTYKLILSKQKQDSISNPVFWCLQKFIRSGLLTFFSSLVIQESLINCAGERLRSKTDSHCESVFCVCLSASYPIHNPRQELQSILREKGLSYKYPLPCLLHNASAMLQGYTQ